MTITVGYMCPRPYFRLGYGSLCQRLHAGERKKKWTLSLTRHAARKLDASLFQAVGVHLSAKACHARTNDAATIACS